MPEDDSTQLRIYCICGQKMKVSESMYGRRGKCVACRQKIRIPRPQDLEEGAREVHLKDHPEFLRKTRPHIPSPDEEDVPLGGEAGETGVVPLDTLDQLRVLCNLEHDLGEKLSGLEPGSAAFDEERDKLRAQCARVDAARTELDEQLRQYLVEAALELSRIEEEAGEAELAARVGEKRFTPYHAAIERLRNERDRLERRRQNLRGWLAVRDRHLAGGCLDADPARIPEEGFRIALPPEPPAEQSRVSWQVGKLGEALRRRGHARRKLREFSRLHGKGPDERRADLEADEARCDAAVRFRRNRLQVLYDDLEQDDAVIKAQLDLARGQMELGQSDRSHFNSVERELLRARANIGKSKQLVERALAAASPAALPRVQGSFITRLSGRNVEIGLDSGIAWGAAAAMLLAVALPVLGELSPIAALNARLGDKAPAVLWLAVGPAFIAALTALAGAVPGRLGRGCALSGAFLLALAAWALFLHECSHALGPIGDAFRAGGRGGFRAGSLLFLLATFATGAAASLALVRDWRGRILLPVVLLAAGLVLLLVFTDFLGIRTPRPVIEAGEWQLDAAGSGQYRGEVTVRNGGRRAMELSPAPAQTHRAYHYALERAGDGGQWADAGQPLRIDVAGNPWPAGGGRFPDAPLYPGVKAVFRYRLPPGEYRVRLTPAPGRSPREETFTLARPTAAPTLNPVPDTDDEPEEEVAATTLDVELSGQASAPGRAPRYRLMLHWPEHSVSKVLSIGDTVYGPWTIREFNTDNQSVTITDGEDILILRHRERVPLASLD